MYHTMLTGLSFAVTSHDMLQTVVTAALVVECVLGAVEWPECEWTDVARARDLNGVCRTIGDICFRTTGGIQEVLTMFKFAYSPRESSAVCRLVTCLRRNGDSIKMLMEFNKKCYSSVALSARDGSHLFLTSQPNPCRRGMQLFEDYQGKAYCDCSHGRMYVASRRRCYWAYTQGPCPRHSHLEYDNRPVCVNDSRCDECYRWWSGGSGRPPGCYPFCEESLHKCYRFNLQPPCLNVNQHLMLSFSTMGGSVKLGGNYDNLAMVAETYIIPRPGIGTIYHELGGNMIRPPIMTRSRMFRLYLKSLSKQKLHLYYV